MNPHKKLRMKTAHQIYSKFYAPKMKSTAISIKTRLNCKLITRSRHLRKHVYETGWYYPIQDIFGSDIIITATNAAGKIIKSEDLKAGDIVIDDAQPSDVDAAVIKDRSDVL